MVSAKLLSPHIAVSQVFSLFQILTLFSLRSALRMYNQKLKQTVRNESDQCQSNDSCECPGCFVVHLGTLDQISKTVIANQHLCCDHTDDTAAESQPDTGEDIRNCGSSTR